MQVTTQQIGAFFRALGEQMIREEGVCAGAIMDSGASRADIIRGMTDRPEIKVAGQVINAARIGLGAHSFEVDEDVAQAIVHHVELQGDIALSEFFSAFGDITLG